MNRMWLEDLDTGAVVKAAEGGVPQSYSFNMDGKTVRHFRWVLAGKGGGKLPPLPE